ncbi:hypothetical protein V1522DRAFT_416270 [Lipomyces starkeyi]
MNVVSVAVRAVFTMSLILALLSDDMSNICRRHSTRCLSLLLYVAKDLIIRYILPTAESSVQPRNLHCQCIIISILKHFDRQCFKSRQSTVNVISHKWISQP